MSRQDSQESGFTLVELMVVVLIIGILVSIATPVYTSASANAEAKSCQANQRTILGVIEMARSTGETFAGMNEGQFVAGGSSWYAKLVPTWIASPATCPAQHTPYYISAQGVVIGDSGAVAVFKPAHALTP